MYGIISPKTSRQEYHDLQAKNRKDAHSLAAKVILVKLAQEPAGDKEVLLTGQKLKHLKPQILTP